MKTAIAKKQQTPRLITVTPWAPEADSATKINHLNRVVYEGAMYVKQAAIMCGWILTVEKANRQGTFQAWVEANLECSKSTAYNYMTLFDRAIASQNENFKLECNDKTREKMVEEYAETVESKTLTELYCDLGIVKKSKSNLGGFREGAGRKRKELTDAAQAAAAAENAGFAAQNAIEAASELYSNGVIKQGFEAMDVPALKTLVDTLASTLEEAKKVLKAK